MKTIEELEADVLDLQKVVGYLLSPYYKDKTVEELLEDLSWPHRYKDSKLAELVIKATLKKKL